MHSNAEMQRFAVSTKNEAVISSINAIGTRPVKTENDMGPKAEQLRKPTIEEKQTD